MKKKKAVALVLAASASATMVLAKNAIEANANGITTKGNTKVKNINTNEIKGQVVNTTVGLRVRQGDSTNTKVLGYMQEGNVFNIVSKVGNWYKIEFNNSYGYVYGEYVKELNGSTPKNSNTEVLAFDARVVNVKTNLTFRAEPNTDSKVLGYFTNKQALKVIGKNGNWFKVKYDGLTGYVDTSYVELDQNAFVQGNMIVVNENTDKVTTEIAKGQVDHVHTDLRVRARATTESNIIGRLYEGNIVNIVGKDGDWYKITTNGGSGFVCADYIQVLKVSSGKTIGEVGSREENLNKHLTDRVVQNKIVNQSNIHSKKVVENRVKANVDSNKVIAEPLSENHVVERKAQENPRVSKKTLRQNPRVVENVEANKVVKPEIISKTQVKPKAIKDMENMNTFGHVVNINSSLRIRSNPTLTSSIIGRLYSGNNVKIIGQEGPWYKIDNNGQVGYVYAQYVALGKAKMQVPVKKQEQTQIKKQEQVPVKKQIPVKKQTQVKPENSLVTLTGFGKVIDVSSSLRIRSGASLNSPVIGSLVDGQTFKIIGKAGSWYKIINNGQVGFVFSEYITKTNSDNNQIVKNNTVNTTKKVENNNSQVTLENAIGQVVNIESNLRVRNAASTNSSVIAYLLNGQNVTVTGKEGNWYRIRLNGGYTGYVYAEYISLNGGRQVSDLHKETSNTSNVITYSHKYGEVINIDSSLRIRSNPSLNSSVVGYLLDGQGVKVLAKVGSWYKIDNNGQIGYSSANYIKLTDKLVNNTQNNNNTPAPTNNNGNQGNNVSNNNGGSQTFARLFAIAREQVGSPYVWGGSGEYITTSLLNSLGNEFPGEENAGDYNLPSQYVNHGYRGFDCSGFVQWVFGQIGIHLDRTTYGQVTEGRAVSLNNVRPGDLLFFKGDYHVGIYIGNNKWIVAPRSHQYVRICNVPWSYIGSARRILS